MAGDNRQEPYLSKNPAGQMPALELDDGVVLCRDPADLRVPRRDPPEPAADRHDAEERGDHPHVDAPHRPQRSASRWPTASASARGCALFQNRVRVHPAGRRRPEGDRQARSSPGSTAWWPAASAIVGDRFTLADILLYVFLEFGGQVGQPLDPANKNLAAWMDRVAARPSAAASA